MVRHRDMGTLQVPQIWMPLPVLCLRRQPTTPPHLQSGKCQICHRTCAEISIGSRFALQGASGTDSTHLTGWVCVSKGGWRTEVAVVEVCEQYNQT